MREPPGRLDGRREKGGDAAPFRKAADAELPPPRAPVWRSLRWRLQAWHALILLLVVTGFGSLLYLETRRGRLDEIDGELVAGARVLEGVLRAGPPREGVGRPVPPRFRRGPGPGPPRGPHPGFGPPPGPEGFPPPFVDAPEGFPPEARPPAGRPGGFLAGRPALARALTLPTSLLDRYEEDGQTPYFSVWTADGTLIAADPEPAEAPAELPYEFEEYHRRQDGLNREVILRGPDHTFIVVGRPIGRELAGLRRLAGQLALTGAGVFGAGLLGGWWLSSRAVRPIQTMSETVGGITASNLSRRIDLHDVDTELGALGTLLNDMLDRLETAFEQQIRFTADASHELRTPLAVILTHLELALARPREAAEYRETLVTCARASTRMKSLVDDLLTLARADAGALELRHEPVDLGSVAAETAELLDTLATKRGVTLTVDARPAELTGDPDRMAQVVTNLVSNAVLYNRPDGSVRVTTCQEGDDAVLTVADTGVGIAPEALPHVFDRFYRVDAARNRSSGGSGLGLAIVKSVVEAHGGTMTVASEPGRGTTFTVRLPVTG